MTTQDRTRQDRTGLIEAIVRERLGDVPVHEVRVTPDTDHEGDAVLRVRVVHGGPVPLDPRATNAVRGDTWDRLVAAGEEAFPIFCSVTPEGAAKPDAARI